MSGDPSRLATLGEDIEWIANRVFIPGSLLAFVTGILLVVESDFYGFGDDWIVIGLALYATTFLAGLLFIGPESARVGKLAEAGSPDVGPRTMRLIMLGRLDLVLLFLLIYDMTREAGLRRCELDRHGASCSRRLPPVSSTGATASASRPSRPPARRAADRPLGLELDEERRRPRRGRPLRRAPR